MGNIAAQYFIFGQQVTKEEQDRIFTALVQANTRLEPFITQCMDRGWIIRELTLHPKPKR